MVIETNFIIRNYQLINTKSTGKMSLPLSLKPRSEITGLRGFRTGQTQTGLYSYSKCLEA